MVEWRLSVLLLFCLLALYISAYLGTVVFNLVVDLNRDKYGFKQALFDLYLFITHLDE